MTQLQLDFGPEHPHNEPRLQRGILIGTIRRLAPLKMAELLCSVQPMSNVDFVGYAMKVREYKPYIPPPEEFELTEPMSEADVIQGCFGWRYRRNAWERSGDPHEHAEGCCH